MKLSVNILFYIAVNSEYPVQVRLAGMLRGQRGFQPVFCFDSSSHRLDKEIAKAKSERFRIIHMSGAVDGNRPDRFLTRTGPLPEEGDHKPSFYLPDLKKLKADAEEKTAFFRSIIREQAIKLAVISGNSCGYNSTWLVRAARLSGIKVCSLPFGMGSPDTNARKMYYSAENRCYKPLNFITGLMFPKWKHRFQGKTFIYAPYAAIWIHELLDAAPYKPWAPQGGNTDMVMVESPYMMDYYLKQGLDQSRLVLTGTLYDDEIARVKSARDVNYRRLCHKKRLDPAKKMILVSIPPLMKSGLESPVSEFKSQEEALVAFLEPLAVYSRRYNIVVSIHPRLFRNEVARYVSKGLAVADEPLESLMGMAGMFVNCQSSTCRMALGAGVPCLDYDFYRFRFTCFNNIPGLMHVESSKDYKTTLAGWLNNGKLEEMQHLAETRANYFSLGDGENHCRILNAIQLLTKRS